MYGTVPVYYNTSKPYYYILILISFTSYLLNNLNFLAAQHENRRGTATRTAKATTAERRKKRQRQPPRDMPVFNNLPPMQRLAAWGVAGVAFGLWTYWDKKDDGKIIGQHEIMQQNRERLAPGHKLKRPSDPTSPTSDKQ